MASLDFRDTIERISAILERAGSQVSPSPAAWRPRITETPEFTQDLDIVIQLAVGRPETAAFSTGSPRGTSSTGRSARGDQAERHFSGDRRDVDDQDRLSCRRKDPRTSWNERTRRTILPGLVAPLVCKEDAILSKLLWIKQGSHKSRHDVTMMLCRDEDLDRASLRQQAARLGLMISWRRSKTSLEGAQDAFLCNTRIEGPVR